AAKILSMYTRLLGGAPDTFGQTTIRPADLMNLRSCCRDWWSILMEMAASANDAHRSLHFAIPSLSARHAAPPPPAATPLRLHQSGKFRAASWLAPRKRVLSVQAGRLARATGYGDGSRTRICCGWHGRCCRRAWPADTRLNAVERKTWRSAGRDRGRD